MSPEDKDGRERLADRGSQFVDRQAGKLADHPNSTLVKWALGIVAVIVVLSIIGGILSFAGAWGGAAKRIVSPPNVEAQYHAVIEDWQSLLASAENACDAKQSKTDENSPTFVGGDPSLAYAQTYRKTVIDYNQRQHNLFEAKLVGPKGYPRTIPAYGDQWCSVASKLRAIHD